MHTSNLWATLALCVAAVHAVPTQQFDQPLSVWRDLLGGIVHGPCHADYESYRSGNIATVSRKTQTVNLINCVLKQMSEYEKAVIAASAVVLGSAPIVLQTLGSTTAETAMLGLRRPFLAILLATGSPTVTTTKSSEFTEFLSKFVKGSEMKRPRVPIFKCSQAHPSLWPFVAVLQYMLAGAAVANVGTLAYQLGVHAVLTYHPTTTLIPPLWTFLAVLVHIGGTVVLHMRVRIKGRSAYHGQRHGVAPSWIPDEFIPTALHSPNNLAWRGDQAWFYVLTWFLSLVTLGQILLGTLFLSSMLFFTVRDASFIISRYAASAILCRAVVQFELAGMKEAKWVQITSTEATPPAADGAGTCDK